MNRIKNRFLFTSVAAWVIFSLILCTESFAVGGEKTTGVIEGRVRDEEGKSLPGVQVTLKNLETNYTRTTTTDENGFYRARLLPLGKYQVEAQLMGFSTVIRRGIDLRIGQVLKIDLKMNLVSIAETITVVGEAPIIETTKTEISTIINEKAIETLPINGRNFADHLRLTSAATKDDYYRVNVGGQRSITNSILMDGVDTNSNFFGEQRGGTRPPFTFSQEAVKEFRVINNSFSAEYGKAMGAVVNAVTKSGTNEFHGSAFYYFRDENLVSRDAYGREYDTFEQHQFGASLGGPLIKDRAFFFMTWDQQELNKPMYVDIESYKDIRPEIYEMLNDRLNEDFGESFDEINGRFTGTEDEIALLFKTDVQITPNHRLTLRDNWTNYESVNGTTGAGDNSLMHNGLEKTKSNSFVASLTSILGQRSFNEFRLQYSTENRPREANTTEYPEIIVEGWGTFGQMNYLPSGLDETRLQILNNFSYSTLNHDIRTGIDLNFLEIDNQFCRYCGGSYYFSGFMDYINKRPSEYAQAWDLTGNNGRVEYETGMHAAYIQDEWNVREGLTVNAGLRYDYQDQPEPEVANEDFPQTGQIPEDKNNFGPRLGVAWDVFNDGKSVLRFGAGMYYAPTPSILVANALLNNGGRVILLTFEPDSPYFPDYPNRIPEFPEGGGVAEKPIIYVFDEDFENSQALRFNVGFEREVYKDLSLALEYNYTHTTKLERKSDINLPAPEDCPDCYQDEEGRWHWGDTRNYEEFDKIVQFESSAESLYNSVSIKAEKRFSNRYQVLTSYTWSKSYDSDSNERSVEAVNGWGYADNQYRMDWEWGPSDWDVRHRFVASGTVEFPWDITGSGIFAYQSGKPFNPTTGTYYGSDVNGDGYKSDRPYENGRPVERNSGRHPAYKKVDLRFARSFKLARDAELEVRFDIFNVFNWDNFRISYNNQVYYSTYDPAPERREKNPYYGRPNSPGTPRQFQLGMRLKF